MSTAGPIHRQAPAAAGAVERYFDISLYLMVLTGFATLAATGKLDLPSLLGVGAALLYRGYLLLQRENLALSERWTSYLTIGYVAFYLADFFLISRTFVAASVHLVLFSLVVKVFSVQRDRDRLYLALLSFLAVLAAAVLTVDSSFLAAFLLFILLAVTTFISLEMKRSADGAAALARASAAASRRLAGSLSGTAALLVVAIFVVAAVIFFVLPRISANYLSAFAPRNQFVSGFSEEVHLGQIGEIQQSTEVMMRIKIQGDATGAHVLKWRGVALALFDGHKWYNTRQSPRILQSRDGNFDLRRLQPAAPQSWRPIRYRVMMEPIGTNVFFLAGQPQVLFGNYREIAVDAALSISAADHTRPVNIYEAIANLNEPSPSGATSEAIPPSIAVAYLQEPRVDPRVRRLTAEVTASAPTDYERARAIEAYLHDKYTYTLELPRTAQADPIAHFLFERRAGHCEYFASSMALMLRTIGIPSRVVNGFRGGEFNEVTGAYIIRGRDAHSWVEAYFPGAGWISFDPTPANPKPAVTSFTRFLHYMDALREFWREWVINYDFSHQNAVGNSVVARGRGWFRQARAQLLRRYHELLEGARRAQARATAAPEQWGSYGVLAVLALLLLLNSRKLVAGWRARRLAAAPERAPQKSASVWYGRMTRSVARRGYPKWPSQTPHEFVVTIDDPQLRRRVEAFTRAYERARFNESPEDAKRLPELFAEIKTPSR